MPPRTNIGLIKTLSAAVSYLQTFKNGHSCNIFFLFFFKNGHPTHFELVFNGQGTG